MLSLTLQTLVVGPAERAYHAGLLEAAFALRHRVFVDIRGWQALKSSDGRDRDARDDIDAIHILFIEGAGHVAGYVRMIPGGYLHVAKPSPAFVDRLADPGALFGISRLCCDPEASDAVQRAGIARLVGACVNYAVPLGITRFTCDTDPVFILFLRSVGFEVEVIGETVTYHDRPMQPVLLTLENEVLSLMTTRLAAWERQGWGRTLQTAT